MTLAVLAIALSGCTIKIGGNATKAPEGGVWASSDAGKNFAQKILVATATGKPDSIATTEVARMVFDPQDLNTIYLATIKNGVIATNDAGATWRYLKSFTSGKVNGVAVDPKYKCTIYALSANKLFKSDDCGRFWQNIYYHSEAKVILTDIAVNYQNGAVIYLANDAGEIMKSVNNGKSWTTVYRIKSASIVDLVMTPKDPNVIYVATAKSGLYKTIDAGATWAALGEGLKSYSGSHDYKSLVVDYNNIDILFLASKYGMLKSENGGINWAVVNLLPAPKATIIYALAINPKNGQELYYATLTALVKSTDGGASWSSQKLPFSYIANRILINPQNPSMIYIGAINPPKD